MSEKNGTSKFAKSDEMEALIGKYLVFEIANQEYGIPIASVKEIVGIMPITRVPKVPDFIPGVVNLRGKIIPIADLGMRFQLQTYEVTDRTCVVVVQLPDGQGIFGVIVENVPEVIDVAVEHLENAPDMGNQNEMRFITAMAKWEERVIMLLALDKLFDTKDFESESGNLLKEQDGVEAQA